MTTIVCTTSSSWPAVARLAATLRAHHPTWPLVVLDPRSAAPAAPPGGAWTVIGLDDLGLDAEARDDLPLAYEPAELAGAVLPYLLRTMLRRGSTRVVLLDDATEVHGDLEEVLADLRSPVGLVPAIVAPEPSDGAEPTSTMLLREGGFATGAMVVQRGAAPFLEWWADRCRWDAVHDAAQGLWGAWRWLDLAPQLFEVDVLRHPGIVLSPLHLHDHGLEPGVLRLLRFPQLDPQIPHLLDPSLERPRTLLSRDDRLRELVAARASALVDGPVEPHEAAQVPPIDLLVRRMLHGALREARQQGVDPPFHLTGEDWSSVVSWLSEPVARPGPPVSRLLHAVWSTRPDLQTVYPRPLGADGEGLVHWATHEQQYQERYGSLQVPENSGARAAEPGAVLPGFDVVGYLDAELGLGEAARLVTRAIELAGLPSRTLTFRATRSRQAITFRQEDSQQPHDVTLLCVNADQTALASAQLPGLLAPDRHRIGYWFWEVDRLRADDIQSLHYVDELWVASEFVRSIFEPHADLPISLFPQPVAPVVPTALRRADLGIDDRFTFAFWFDAFSSVERKNPVGLVHAFCRAFRPDEGPVLLVKSINGDADRRGMEALHAAAASRPDVRLVDGYWSGVEMRSLVQLIDCYVSLHRSEGFGQTLAEAMMAARPVVATAHSGNLEFMTETNSLLVPAELVPVGPGCPPYPADARWAEPDLDVAAAHLRSVVEDDALRLRLSRQGAADVQRTNGMDVAAAWLRARFASLHAGVAG